MTSLRVVLTHATDASGHYRIVQPSEALVDDPNVTPRPVRSLPLEFDSTGAFVDCAIDCDVLVLQRPMYWFMVDVMRFYQRKGIPVIVELDDDFTTAHPKNPAFVINHPRRNPDANWKHLGACVREADWVTVSTPALKRRYGAHGRCSVIRNSIDDDWLNIRPKTIPKTLGWPGTVVHHANDLQATGGAVAWTLDENPDWRFNAVGGALHIDEIVNGLELNAHRNRVIESGFMPLDLHAILMSQIDVGIVPLDLTAFNQAKSYLKGLQLASLGIPFVASATDEYDLLASQGIGITVPNKARHWRSTLQAVMSERDAFANSHRGLVKDKHVISHNAHLFAEVWQEVADRGVSSERRQRIARSQRRGRTGRARSLST